MNLKFQLSEPLPFILKQGLTVGYIEMVNGCHCIIAGDFKQFIKASELKKITEKNILAGSVSEDIQSQPETAGTAPSEPEPQPDSVEIKAPAKGRGTRRK